jgi:hypothetical protein
MQTNMPHWVATRRDKGGRRSGAERRVNAVMVVIPERRRRGERRVSLEKRSGGDRRTVIDDRIQLERRRRGDRRAALWASCISAL